ncbi:MAG: DotA/TraY family protein [Alphaproteobacteria bacterium]
MSSLSFNKFAPTSSFQAVARALGGLLRAYAMIFASFRLISPQHPAFSAANFGFGEYQEIVRAARLGVRQQRWPLLGGLAYYTARSFLWLSLFGVSAWLLQLGMGHAFAQTAPNATTFFQLPQEDVPQQIVSSFFQFGSTIPAQKGLGEIFSMLLRMYNSAVLVLGGALVVWSVLNIVVDTAHHGVMFGKRHNELWAPVRLIVGLGALVPIDNGFNTAQILMVQVAKGGSALASTMWAEWINKADFGLDRTTDNPNGMTTATDDIVFRAVLQATCRKALNETYTQGGTSTESPTMEMVEREEQIQTNDDKKVIAWSNVRPAANIFAIFGPGNISTHNRICGAATFFYKPGAPGSNISDKQMIYYDALVASMIGGVADRFTRVYMPNGGSTDRYAVNEQIASAVAAARTKYRERIEAIGKENATVAAAALQNALKPGGNKKTEFGWISAGIYGMLYSDYAGKVLSGFNDLPGMEPVRVTEYYTEDENKCNDSPECKAAKVIFKTKDELEAFWVDQGLKPPTNTISNPAGSRAQTANANGIAALIPMASVISVITANPAAVTAAAIANTPPQNVAMKPVINWTISDTLKHVLAWGHALIGLGALLVALGVAAGAQVLGNGIVFALSALIFAIASPILIAGLTCAYMIPVMILGRFVFGAVTWVLHLAEAVVAAPLIMLTHLRSDGEGFFGPNSLQGYMLVVQIFLRPPLMIFGLLCALMGFNVAANLWSRMFWSMVANSNSYAAFNPVAFAGVGLSSIFVWIALLWIKKSGYLAAANMCFRMIDVFPDQVLRWIGQVGLAGHGEQAVGQVSNMQEASQFASAVSSAVGSQASIEGLKGVGGTFGTGNGGALFGTMGPLWKRNPKKE